MDIKTQKIKPGAKASAYKSWSYQLAAYRKALGVEARCINLIVNSVVPETPVEHVWGETEMDAGLRAFLAARELWVIEKGYDPGPSRAGHYALTPTSSPRRGSGHDGAHGIETRIPRIYTKRKERNMNWGWIKCLMALEDWTWARIQAALRRERVRLYAQKLEARELVGK